MRSSPPAQTTPVPHLTVAERVGRGKTARAEVPRSSHAAFEPVAGRPDPVELLERQAATRVPELVPIRYGRMLVSPFAFFRGAALVMAADLADTPVSGLRTQICGDAHISNFGLFASPERRLVFDLNDFDETLPGPWEWDVKRLAASMAVAGRAIGFTAKQRARIIRETVAAYRQAMHDFAGMKNLEVFYARLDADDLAARFQGRMTKAMRARLTETLSKAQTADSLKAFSKLTHQVDGEPRIAGSPPLIETLDDRFGAAEAEALRDSTHDLLRSYRSTLDTDRRAALERFRIVDLAHKVVGVGSVGSRAWIALLLGRDAADPLFLQFKEAQPSVLEEFLGASAYDNHGHRVVAGQRLMQATGDIFLGWQRVTGPDGVDRDFYARQLKDWKGSFDVEGARPEGAALYGRTCGWTLARAHARSGDPIAIAAYLGRGDAFDRAIAHFAEAYADQNERDYAALLAAADAGRIAVRFGL
ncbi:MAG TPA: DUF2252 domain-containing protein [Baekduia sp.]|nr:DUF2252 domain-containing protein [Baekduia sp.]